MNDKAQQEIPAAYPEIFALWPHEQARTMRDKLLSVRDAVESARETFRAKHRIEPTVVWIGKTQRWWVELEVNPRLVLGPIVEVERPPVTHFCGMEIFWAAAKSFVMVGIMEGAWEPTWEPSPEETSAEDQEAE